MTARSLPARSNLDQLKRQAKELLRRQPQLGRLRDAQRIIAEEYGWRDDIRFDHTRGDWLYYIDGLRWQLNH